MLTEKHDKAEQCLLNLQFKHPDREKRKMKSLEGLKVNPKVSMLVPPLFCPYSSVLDIKKVKGDNFESIKELVLVKPCP